MKNEFEDWQKKNDPAGQAWAGRLLAMAAAGTATAAVWLSIVLMAGLDLPPGDQLAAVRAPATAAASSARTVRYASALPTVTVVARRESAEPAAFPADATAALPARTASMNATVGMSSTGDNLRQ